MEAHTSWKWGDHVITLKIGLQAPEVVQNFTIDWALLRLLLLFFK